MDSKQVVVNYGNSALPFLNSYLFLKGQAKMLQNGVIMDVTNREQAEIAQKVFYFH